MIVKVSTSLLSYYNMNLRKDVEMVDRSKDY